MYSFKYWTVLTWLLLSLEFIQAQVGVGSLPDHIPDDFDFSNPDNPPSGSPKTGKVQVNTLQASPGVLNKTNGNASKQEVTDIVKELFQVRWNGMNQRVVRVEKKLDLVTSLLEEQNFRYSNLENVTEEMKETFRDSIDDILRQLSLDATNDTGLKSSAFEEASGKNSDRHFNKTKYKIMHVKDNWKTAKRQCKKIGMNLVAIETPEELENLIDFIHDRQAVDLFIRKCDDLVYSNGFWTAGKKKANYADNWVWDVKRRSQVSEGLWDGAKSIFDSMLWVSWLSPFSTQKEMEAESSKKRQRILHSWHWKQPDGDGNCANMAVAHHYRLNDYPCNKKNCYICEEN